MAMADGIDMLLDKLVWRVMRPTMRYVWNEGYKAGVRDMDQLRDGRSTFQDITTNPLTDEEYLVRRYGDADKAREFWGLTDE